MNDTILRAMAVDMHLRFRTVDEFEKVVCQKKKVLGVVKEKKRRKKNRIIGLSAAILAVGIGLTLFIYTYEQQRLEMTLPDGTIEFWFAVSDDEESAAAKENSIEAIIASFTTDEEEEDGTPKGYPNVTIEPIAIPYDEYIARIQEAYENDKLPHLFESTGVDFSILENTSNTEDVIELINLEEILFSRHFNIIEPENKKLPLGFIMPVVYRNSVPLEDDGAETDERKIFLLGKSEEYIGTTADFYEMMDAVALWGKLSLHMLEDDDIICSYAAFMSIGDCGSDELKIAERFLAFLYTGFAQDFLHIQYQSGVLPLNYNILTNVFIPTYQQQFHGFFTNVRRLPVQ